MESLSIGFHTLSFKREYIISYRANLTVAKWQAKFVVKSMVWTLEDVAHPCIFTMHAPGFGEHEESDLGTARRRWQNRQAANVNRATTWQSEVGKTPS
jgi:hypothetical protein